MLRTALTGAAAGAAAYAAADLAADVATFTSLQRAALELAERDPAVEAAVGPRPWSAARWYWASGGATLAYSHGGHAARATFALEGPKGATDVVARGVRGPGYAWNAAYNLLSGGRWALASCAAMVPAPGGVARAHELMEPRSLARAWVEAGGKLPEGLRKGEEGGGDRKAGEEEEGDAKAAKGAADGEQRQRQQQQRPAGRRWGGWWPRRKKGQEAESPSAGGGHR